MKIYTKTGDEGYTSNIMGQKIFKGDPIIELQGSIDEVNACIGYLRSVGEKTLTNKVKEAIDSQLRDIQYTIFRIGGDVTSSFTSAYVTEKDVDFLENEIDKMTDKTGALKNFIYFSGNEAATYCHVVRSVVRRAEREFVRTINGRFDYTLDYKYINRLADYFFTLARYMNYIEGDEEEIMKLK